jgi:hypothetical protein
VAQWALNASVTAVPTHEVVCCVTLCGLIKIGTTVNLRRRMRELKAFLGWGAAQTLPTRQVLASFETIAVLSQ